MAMFKNDALNVSDRQRRQKLMLHQILNVYPHINFMNIGLSIDQKLNVRRESLKAIYYSTNNYQ